MSKAIDALLDYFLSDIIQTLHKDKRELFRMHYYIKVVLNHSIDTRFNFPELILLIVIRTKKETKFLE